MKWILCLFALITFCPRVEALPPQPIPPKLFSLMKCSSMKNGTLWMSFGHLIRSGENVPVYFPTEIVLFAPNFSARQVFMDYKEALKLDIQVQGQGMRLNFSLPREGESRAESIRLIQNDRYDPSLYMGNWSATEPGQETVIDQIACSTG